MYPLENFKNLRRGYRHGQPTSYSPRHFGVDLIVPSGTRIVAPFNGSVVYAPFSAGGEVINFTCTTGGQKYVMRFMHNSKIVKTGQVRRGDLIALSGNTGTQTTQAHSHLDASKNAVNINNFNNFVDPDTFNWATSEGDIVSNLNDLKLRDLGEEDFNKLHDLFGCFYEGYTKESKPVEYKDWQVAYGADTNMHEILDVAWRKQASLKKRRYDLREAYNVLPGIKDQLKQCQSSGAVDKLAIKGHTDEINKLIGM